MIKVDNSIVINRPVDEVFQFLNTENATLWAVGLQESSVISETPEGVGSQWKEVYRVLGQRLELLFEVTTYEPHTRLDFKTVSSPVSIEGGYTFESVGDGTRVHLVFEGELKGFFKVAESLVNSVTQRQWDTNLENLKDVLEAQAETSS